ncbi:hypothetical protein OG883_36835 [Streptomyces sp. NBC_01142]|uniref:hypothetical protein n=1 Tax=Streptomyces sp. NBC_01142 TaxID=2975865 RepID=UPI00225898D3|nr:hypothetical protein [Streptomyces sp. NBC_01142]MCX4825325.1 hypothetical protein [Streptomyces sp. NBC_01142]
MSGHAPVIVLPPLTAGGRRVTIHGQIVGLAHGRGDVAELVRRAGLGREGETIDLLDEALVEWRGGGVDDWPVPHA